MKWQLALGLLAATLVAGQAPDNTKANAQGGATATNQKMDKQDQELARKIRKSVVADKSLSTYAHNVKIIVADGHVTLKGPVRNADEKDKVEKAAATYAGASNVDSQLDIVPPKS